MMKKLKTAKLAKVILAAVLAMGISTTAFAAPPGHPDNTRGRVVEVEFTTTTDADGIGDPDIYHPALSHSSECGEYLHDTNLTVGDLNKAFDVLVVNEQGIMTQLKGEAELRAAADVKSGVVSGTDIILTKGDSSTITIDASSLVGVSTDTYVTAGSYADSSKTITLQRNNGKENIDIELTNVATTTDVANEATARANGDVVSGAVTGTNIVLTKGDSSTVTIDASSLVGSVSDTYVTAGSYNGDSQKITLNRNNEKPDIDIQLTNVAKASDVNNLEQRVETNETNITNLQGDVTNLDNRVTTNETNITNLQGDVTNLENRVSTNETNITNLQGDVTNLDNRVTTNETNITKLQGDVIKDGSFANNTITLNRVSGENPVTIAGIASADDLAAEVQRSTDKDTEHDAGIAANKTAIENEVAARQAADDVLAGEDISSGHMNGNTLVLEKNNKKTVEVAGIATTGDIDNLQVQVDNNKTEIQNNKERIEKESSERKSEDARLDKRIDEIQQNVTNVGDEVRRLDGKLNKGVALAIAHASLKPLPYDPHAKWSGALGMGSYHGENALAAGLFYQPNNDWLFNISFSTCGSEKSVGGGVSFRFK